MKLAHTASLALCIAMSTITANAAPIEPRQVDVVDGDTIRVDRITYRLVGFDTPEQGSHARCEPERALAARATSRLRQLIAGGGLDLQAVACACRPGTEGTRRCNYGRSCAVLVVRGRPVADILIGERLARPYVCSGTRCPPRGSWCEETR